MSQRCCVSVLVSSEFATALKRLRMMVESCSDAVSQVKAASTWRGVLKWCVSLIVGRLVCSWWMSVVLMSFLMAESWVRAVFNAESKSCCSLGRTIWHSRQSLCVVKSTSWKKAVEANADGPAPFSEPWLRSSARRCVHMSSWSVQGSGAPVSWSVSICCERIFPPPPALPLRAVSCASKLLAKVRTARGVGWICRVPCVSTAVPC